MLLYLMSFLDRSVYTHWAFFIFFPLTHQASVNIGNARLYNLEDDLNLTGNQFQVAVSILFVTYIIFEVSTRSRPAS